MPITDYIVYDCESKRMAQETQGGWKNIFGMGLASCVIWDTRDQQYHFFGPGDKERERCCQYMHKRICVSFNGVTFDSFLLLGNDRRLKDNKVSNEKHYWFELDIFFEILKKVIGCDDYDTILNMPWKERSRYCPKGVYNLDTIAIRTVNVGKSGVSSDGPKYFKEENWAALFGYNLQDVRALKEVKEFIQNKTRI